MVGFHAVRLIQHGRTAGWIAWWVTIGPFLDFGPGGYPYSAARTLA